MERRLRNRLREVRLSRGLSQKELSERSGVSAGTLSRYEFGKAPLETMSVGMALSLAGALETTVTDLFTVGPGERRKVYMVFRTNVVMFPIGSREKEKGFTRDLQSEAYEHDFNFYDTLDEALAVLKDLRSWAVLPFGVSRERRDIAEAVEYYVEGVFLDPYGEPEGLDGVRTYAEFE
ncbi:MAG: helix-turn-helix transcriptional regulator [Ruminococcus sp.]|nr:helix-turn-helix transcriptional regulator [Ruminococcus sp.]